MDSTNEEFHPVITIQNFKKFHKKVSFELSPLTILVGPNGGGKSTIIEALNFFQRTIKLLISPNTEDFTWLNSHNFSDIASEAGSKKRIILSSTASEYLTVNSNTTELEMGNKLTTNQSIVLIPTIKIFFKNSNEQVIVEKLEFILHLDSMEWKVFIFPDKKNILLKESHVKHELQNNLNSLWLEHLSVSNSYFKEETKGYLTVLFPKTYGSMGVKYDSETESEDEIYTKIFNSLLGIILFNIEKSTGKYSAEKERDELYLTVLYALYKEKSTNIDQLNPLDYDEEFGKAWKLVDYIIYCLDSYWQKYLLTDKIEETRYNPASVFEYQSKIFLNDYYGLCQFILSTPQEKSYLIDDNQAKSSEDLIKLFKEFDIADFIKLKEIASLNPNRKYYEMRLTKNGSEFNVAQLSSGGKQLVPIILALVLLPQGGNISIKQPELHLHPKLQMKLADLICAYLYERLDSDNGYILIETHSEHLIRRLQILVAQNKLNKSDMNILFISPEEGKNSSNIIKLEMDDRGIFTTPWPGGFFEESSSLNIQLIEEILKRKN